MPPTIYVIAGPNGAGKTTFASKFLPGFVNCKEFLNADLIAAGLSPFDPESQSVAAGKIMLQRMDELAQKGENFSFETTLSGRGHLKRLNNLKAAGYEISLFFLYLPSAAIAEKRVALRVRQGDHNIPVDDIRRRFTSGIKNFFAEYSQIVDSWTVYNAIRMPPALIATSEHGTEEIVNETLFQNMKKRSL